ncbi:hypothetical protein FE257_005500 [Aspergillus nanangensis]|uniref:Uncharacterized protein n=1 Tax=Aspergillus nanangensis TaxID=2582783 RepID=A0AAD4CA72_ASPNN|nr:hypothetical protein FE257_005500 [Aspergillus nanangensis]
MAISFAAAVQSDGHVLAETREEEESALKDRDIARRWTENNLIEVSKDLKLESASLDDETLAKLQILYVSSIEDCHVIGGADTADTKSEQAESSAQGARRTGHSSLRDRRCVACREQTDLVNVVRAPSVGVVPNFATIAESSGKIAGMNNGMSIVYLRGHIKSLIEERISLPLRSLHQIPMRMSRFWRISLYQRFSNLKKRNQKTQLKSHLQLHKHQRSLISGHREKF